jgi:RNA polymerase sigma-70 factor, ECF subfamily
MVQQISPEILKRCRLKDVEAFQKLVEHYQAYAFKLAFRLVCNDDDAKDVIQESFIRVWKHIHEFDSKNQFSTWLFKIVTNLCFDYLKSKKRRNNIPLEQLSNAAQNLMLDKEADESFININLIQVIGALANELTPKQRAAFILRDLQEMEMDEIAEILNMSTEKIKSNLYYARQNIRQKLKKMNLLEL